MALPNSNITTTLVGTTLGSGSRDVGTLCTHPNINKWSKWKPVSFNSVDGLTEANLQSVNFGLSIPNADSDEGTALALPWVYNKPAGGASSPYRLGDFRNYEHASICPFDLTMPNYIIKGGSGVIVKLNPKTVASYNISTNDTCGSKYFGVLIKKGAQVQYKTATATIASGGTTVDFSASPLIATDGTVELFCFYTSLAIPSLTSSLSQILYSLNAEPNLAYRTTQIYTPMPDTYSLVLGGIATIDRTAILPSGNTVVAGGLITQSASLTRSVSQDYTLKNITVKITRNSDNVVVFDQTYANDGFGSPEAIYTDMSAGESVNFRSTLFKDTNGLPLLDMSDYYKVVYTLNY